MGDTLTMAWCRRALVIGIASAVGVISAPGADSANAPAPVATEQKDSIDAAKREFDAMKAVRDPSQQQKGALPRFATPELHTDSTLPLPSISGKGKKPDETKKGSNWLVDAMEKSAREAQLRSRPDPDGRRGDLERERLTEQELLVRGENETELETAERLEKNDRTFADAKEKREVANPLTAYLSNWMTPQDYAILKPGLDQASSGKNAAELRASESLQLELPASLTARGVVGLGASNASALPPPPRENPYLQGVIAPATSAPGPIALPSPPIATAPPARVAAPILPSTPPPVAAPAPKIPDFAKPAQDEKYFKQLKRF